MKTMNSVSGGKTSAYIAANYPADYNIFSLVRVKDQNCLFPDAKIRQEVEDRIQAPFIGTVEEDTIIYTMLDLEQFLGKKITWVTGREFEEVVTMKNGKTVLPNVQRRVCTLQMKIEPMFYWWLENINEIVETRIGFRANETRRAENMIERASKTNGILTCKAKIGKHKDGRNKWADVPYQIPRFPLIEDNIYKDKIEEFWKDKPVRFAYMNNCVGCFHRSPMLLNMMYKRHPEKMEWFNKIEQKGMADLNGNKWKQEVTYAQIKEYQPQYDLFDSDFNECDSGYCGL
jgi:hypothetical protein